MTKIEKLIEAGNGLADLAATSQPLLRQSARMWREALAEYRGAKRTCKCGHSIKKHDPDPDNSACWAIKGDRYCDCSSFEPTD